MFLATPLIGIEEISTFTVQQWQADLDFMAKFLKETHPNPFTKITETDFTKNLQKIRIRIPDMNKNEIVTEFMKLSTSIKDGHTMLFGENLTHKWFPIRIEKFHEGYYITVTQPDLKHLIGKRVIRINDLRVDELFKKIKSVGIRENEYASQYYSSVYLMMERILKGLDVISGSNSTLRIRIEGDDKEISIKSKPFKSDPFLSWFWLKNAIPSIEYVRINDLKKDKLPLYLRDFETPYWFHHDLQKKLVYLGFNECRNVKTNPFEIFCKKMWSYIDENQVNNLVIDLRHNIGGTNGFFLPLVHQIIKHDRINSKEHLYVIISNKTWSAAIHLATLIEKHCNVIFVGQPTAAGPNHFADPKMVTLPHSKVLLMVSRNFWQTTVPTDKRKAIHPILPVIITARDFFNYNDQAMNRITDLIKKKQ